MISKSYMFFPPFLHTLSCRMSTNHANACANKEKREGQAENGAANRLSATKDPRDSIAETSALSPVSRPAETP